MHNTKPARGRDKEVRDEEYVVRDVLTALWLYSRWQFRENTIRLSTKQPSRGQKRARLDLAQNLPSCKGPSTRNGSLSKGRSRRRSKEGPSEKPGNASTTNRRLTPREELSAKMITKESHRTIKLKRQSQFRILKRSKRTSSSAR